MTAAIVIEIPTTLSTIFISILNLLISVHSFLCVNNSSYQFKVVHFFLSLNYSLLILIYKILNIAGIDKHLPPPGKRTTGISPAQIRSRIAQVVNPRYSAAFFKDISRGHIGLTIPCAVFFSIIPIRFAMLCLFCAYQFPQFSVLKSGRPPCVITDVLRDRNVNTLIGCLTVLRDRTVRKVLIHLTVLTALTVL